jgi:Uma2 family endonuclease
MTMTTMPTVRTRIDAPTGIVYPESDGKPLGETGIHVNTIFRFVDAMWRHYDDHPKVAVLTNMFLYYVEGDPKRNVCPDVFVTLGVPSNRNRRTFMVWEEVKGPDVVVEITSRKTKRDDTKRKFELYRDVLKVREYFLFDPLEEYLNPSLLGFRLLRGQYQTIPMMDGRVPSKVLGFHFERNDLDLRVFNPRTGLWLPTSLEMARMLRASKAAERRAKMSRRQAESEVERLRQENESLRKRISEKS